MRFCTEHLSILASYPPCGDFGDSPAVSFRGLQVANGGSLSGFQAKLDAIAPIDEELRFQASGPGPSILCKYSGLLPVGSMPRLT